VTISDDGKTVGLFEPLMVSENSPARAGLNDLVLELAEKSAAFRSGLPASVSDALADLVRAMNCYYSNLIEGHDTHPIDIERAMRNDYSADPSRRNLQLEAKAHVAVQKWVDEDGMSEPATAPSSIVDLHRRFCELLPPELLFVQNPKTGEQIPVVPGELRTRYVEVGRHVAISPGAVPRFLERMDKAYSLPGRIEAILAAACAHHRLLWVHPFLDGNGRVARLMSYAMLRKALDTRGLWSVARGLARQPAIILTDFTSLREGASTLFIDATEIVLNISDVGLKIRTYQFGVSSHVVLGLGQERSLGRNTIRRRSYWLASKQDRQQ